MSEQPQVNEAEARTPEGELRSQTPLIVTTPPEAEIKPETKPDIKPEGEVKPEPKPGAPEAYADFKLPEGVELKAPTLEKATATFKELGLSQEAAQKIVDLHIAEIQAAAKAPVDAYDEMRAEWKAKAQADPDIGSFTGSKALGMKEDIGRALDALNDKQLKTDFQYAMDLTGLGDNAAFIKVASKWAKSVIEPRNVRGDGPSQHGQNDKGQQQRPNVAQGMYPNLKP
jgi:hypothetical protein